MASVKEKQEPTGCRWIYGDPLKKGWHYCQKAEQPDSSYCPEHHEVAHLKEGTRAYERTMRNFNHNANVTGGAMCMHNSAGLIEVKGNGT